VKFGRKLRNYNFLATLKDAHTDRDCKGEFTFNVYRNVPSPIGALGDITLPAVPMYVCPDCEATYIDPSFRERAEKICAIALITSKALLGGNQLKFLRQYFDLSQEDFGGKVGIDKFTVSRIESGARQMDPYKQVVLKMKLAKIVGYDDLNELLKIADIDDTRIAEINRTLFPSEKDLKNFG